MPTTPPCSSASNSNSSNSSNRASRATDVHRLRGNTYQRRPPTTTPFDSHALRRMTLRRMRLSLLPSWRRGGRFTIPRMRPLPVHPQLPSVIAVAVWPAHAIPRQAQTATPSVLSPTHRRVRRQRLAMPRRGNSRRVGLHVGHRAARLDCDRVFVGQRCGGSVSNLRVVVVVVVVVVVPRRRELCLRRQVGVSVVKAPETTDGRLRHHTQTVGA